MRWVFSPPQHLNNILFANTLFKHYSVCKHGAVRWWPRKKGCTRLPPGPDTRYKWAWMLSITVLVTMLHHMNCNYIGPAMFSASLGNSRREVRDYKWEKAVCHCCFKNGGASRARERTPTDSSQRNKGLIMATSTEFCQQPERACKWILPDNTWISALWNPEQRTQLSHLQKRWDNKWALFVTLDLW